MKKNNYWRKRELQHIKKKIKDDERITRRIKKKYRESMEEIQEQVEAFYGRYASKEGISMEEARKRVKQLDIEKYARKANKYVKEKNFTPTANEEMRLYNVTMKINRLELLKRNIHLELLAMTSEEEHLLYKELSKEAREEFKRLSGILGMTIKANEKHIKDIVNSSFLNAEWSDRIWTNQTALQAELDKLLERGIVQGKNPRELAKDLRKAFDAGSYDSERIMRTEMARVQQDVFQESMKQAEITQYEFIAEPDACPICSDLDGKIFKLKDARIGENAYPIHPNCRCSQAAYVDRDEWDEELKARGL